MSCISNPLHEKPNHSTILCEVSQEPGANIMTLNSLIRSHFILQILNLPVEAREFNGDHGVEFRMYSFIHLFVVSRLFQVCVLRRTMCFQRQGMRSESRTKYGCPVSGSQLSICRSSFREVRVGGRWLEMDRKSYLLWRKFRAQWLCI